MMTRNIRKIVSIICAVAILLSISVVSFIGSSSALVDVQGDLTKPAMSEEVNLTFQGEQSYGIPLGRYTNDVAYLSNYARVKYSTNWIFFGKDGTVGQTTVKHSDPDTSKVNAALANLYKVVAGNTYVVSFKYKLLQGTYFKDVTAFDFSAGVSVNPVTAGKNDANVSGLKIVGHRIIPSDIQTTGTNLDADTDWYTANVEFKCVNDGYFGIRCGNNYVSGYFALDDVVISKVSGSYGIITHDMENDAIATNQTGSIGSKFIMNQGHSENKDTKFVDSNDGHGKVLQMTGTKQVRGTFGDSNVFQKGKRYYISFDAKSTTGSAQTMFLGLAGLAINNNNFVGSQANPRVNFDASCPFKYYIDGVETSFANFKLSTDWQRFGIVIDFADASVVSHVEGHTSDFFNEPKCFYFGVNGSWYDNFEIVCVGTDVTPGNAFVEEVVDDKVKFTALTVGSKYTLTTPVDTTGDRGFKCWVDADGKEIEDPNNYIPSKGYNKVTATWTTAFVKVTFVDGSTTSVPTRVGVGTKLLPPEKRPNANLFFQGWVDADGKVYTEAPDKNITLYAKYNGTVLTFNKVFTAEGQNGTVDKGSLVADPDNAHNSVFKLISDRSTKMIAIPTGDYDGAKKFELKTNTTYTYSIRYKVGAGSKGGEFQLVRGNGIFKNNSLERTEIPGVSAVKVSASETASEWRTITGTFTIGDSHYLERVYWYYQNNLILKSTGEFEIYFDDIVVAEVLNEAPKGTYAINFKTNGPEIIPIYGFPGETVELPTNIINGTSKFIGWYTDKKLSVPYTATEFGNEDITLYAKWDVGPFVMDLEDYDNSGPASRCHLEVDSNGNHYFNWNSDFKPEQSAVTMYSQQVNANGMYCTLLPGVEYTVTFKYKLLKGSFDIGVVYNNAGGSWSDRQEGVRPLKLTNIDEKNWQTASFTFTADYDEDLNYLNFGVAGLGNCYFDDIIVECSANMANLYGSTIIMLNPNGGKNVDPVSGDPGELIGKLPTATRAGYQFDGWYIDSECKTKFTDKVFGEEGCVLYAKWVLGKFNENFEDFPKTITLAGGYKLYNQTNFKTNFDKNNVHSGGNSIFRNGTTAGDKAFTICRNDELALTEGKQYTVTFYVKPTNVGQAAGTISLISMDKYATGVNAPSKKEIITTVGELKAGEWQKVSYTFTASNKYVGISTSTGNDLYFDNFTVTLKGYTGTTTGDNSVNPMLIVMMIVLAAGALTVTGKKVFEK